MQVRVKDEKISQVKNTKCEHSTGKSPYGHYVYFWCSYLRNSKTDAQNPGQKLAQYGEKVK